MSKKHCFRGPLRQTTREMGPNTVAIGMAPPLKYLLMTLKVVALEKLSLSDTQNHKAVS